MMLGILEGMFHVGTSYLAGRWLTLRRVSVGALVAVLAIFSLLQPVKHGFREQVWTAERKTGEVVGVSGRVEAWGDAFSTSFGDSPKRDADEGHAVASRFSEFGPVVHALDVVPTRVPFCNGDSLLPLLYSPIPRLIWPDKPITKDTLQRYAIIFNRQTEAGAQTTAVGITILVEGYWNFGWAGIVGLCAVLGAFLGVSQGVFSGNHWAARVLGIAQTGANLGVGSIVTYLGSVFQHAVAWLLVCWMLYGLARAMSPKRRMVRQVGGRPHPASPLRRPVNSRDGRGPAGLPGTSQETKA
jgi:hypothetical protein